MRLRTACTVLLAVFSWSAGAEGLDAARKMALDQELGAIVHDTRQPLASLSALAIRDGKVVYQGQFGNRVLPLQAGDKGYAADARTLYRIASISKLVSTLGAMRLVEEGKLDLDADISGYLGFKVANPNFPDSTITTRMLLSHTSSLRDDAGYSMPIDAPLQSLLQPQGSRFDKGVWAARNELHDRTPGRFFHYVNLNFGVLATVIEAITHERFDQYMQRVVLKPLGIPGAFTAETLSQEDVNHLAVLYRKGQDGAWKSDGPWVPQTDDFQGKLPVPRVGLDRYVPGTNALGFGAQGGLRTSVEGLSRIMRMLMNGGELDGVRILKSTSVAAMQEMQWRYDVEPLNGDNFGNTFYSWGLGTQRYTDFSSGAGRGDRLVPQGGLTGFGHIGLAYGLQSMFFYDPAKRIGLIYAIGGSGIDPALAKGRYSAYYAWEEKILDAMHRYAIQTLP
ncbi:MAG: serine hydrolase [Rhodoferax sp.]|nr:serine hydrolase [Rhodoferax sp.]